MNRIDETRIPWPPPTWQQGDPPMVRLLVTEREYQMLMSIRSGKLQEIIDGIRNIVDKPKPQPRAQHASTCTCWRCKNDPFADLPEEESEN